MCGLHLDLSPDQSQHIRGTVGTGGSPIGSMSWGASVLEEL